VGSVTIGNDLPFVLIGGPDSIESLNHAMFMAKSINDICLNLGIPFIFKASFDKANRTSIKSFRGVGIERGMKILGQIKKELKIPVTSDVHEPAQAKYVSGVLDLIQIPALLSRQTDLLISAAKTKKAINIKKGQFIAPHNVDSVIAKTYSTGNKNILLTERGYVFGYNNVVVDMRGLETMKKFGAPIIFDASHTVQFPSDNKNKSSGDSGMIAPLARAAVGVGVAGIFIEIHNNPSKSPVDGDNSLLLKDLRRVLKLVKEIDKLIKEY